jgi:hypothetical protein
MAPKHGQHLAAAGVDDALAGEGPFVIASD